MNELTMENAIKIKMKVIIDIKKWYWRQKKKRTGIFRWQNVSLKKVRKMIDELENKIRSGELK